MTDQERLHLLEAYRILVNGFLAEVVKAGNDKSIYSREDDGLTLCALSHAAQNILTPILAARPTPKDPQ